MEKVTLYEYKIVEEGEAIVKIIREDIEYSPSSDGGVYVVRKSEGRRKLYVSGRSLDKVERNIVYSLDDDFDKYATMLIESYKEKTDQLQQQLEGRKKILNNLLKKRGK